VGENRQFFVGLLAVFVGACTGVIGEGSGEEPRSSSEIAPATPKSVPLLRLTTLQYNNTLRDLLPAFSLPQQKLPQELSISGFVNNARAQSLSPALIEQLAENARAVAEAVTVDTTKLSPCAATESECGHAFIDAFAPRAFRHPLTDGERARLLSLFDSAYSAYGYQTALRMLLEGILQSPQFLYLVEEGTAQPDGRYLLTPPELASRMSYFLWNTMPDDALRTSAFSGKLGDSAELDAQLSRMLEDPRAHDAVARFHEQWLHFEKLAELDKDRALYPQWTDTAASDLRSLTARYVDDVFWNGGNLTALLTDTHGFVTDSTAWMYGVPVPGSTTGKRVELDPAQRSGILTQPGLLAAFGHQTVSAPILRGVFVRERLLCLPNGTPPPGTPTATPPATSTAKTTRQRIAQQHTAQTACYGCHHAIDGIGFAFEHYDAAGAWRNTENGEPIDASGEIFGADDTTNGKFTGAIELGKKLAESRQVHSCVATEWTRYALGLDRDEINDAMVAPITAAFVEGKLDFRKLLAAIVKSEAFRLRVRLP
jgi:hypothetical protein